MIDVSYFQPQFIERSDEDIVKEILNSGHVYKKIQLLGILLKRHDEDFLITKETTGEGPFINYVDK